MVCFVTIHNNAFETRGAKILKKNYFKHSKTHHSQSIKDEVARDKRRNSGAALATTVARSAIRHFAACQCWWDTAEEHGSKFPLLGSWAEAKVGGEGRLEGRSGPGGSWGQQQKLPQDPIPPHKPQEMDLLGSVLAK